MKKTLRRFGRMAAVCTLVTVIVESAHSQGWEICWDPTNMMPVSTDYFRVQTGNAAMVVGIGASGNVSWGPDSPCGEPPGNDPQDAVGYIMLRNSFLGSLLSLDDDNCAITMGAPWAGNRWSYATIRVIGADGSTNDRRWAATNGWSLFPYNTASLRRIVAADAGNGVTARLTVRSVANAIRFQWDLINTTEETLQVGMRHASWLGFINVNAGWSGFAGNAYVLLPTGRPVIVNERFVRSADPINFPQRADFFFRQANPYPGLRVLTDQDSAHPDQSTADELVITDWIYGGVGDNLWSLPFFPDRAIANTTFCVYYNPVPVGPGATRTIVYYLEIPMVNSDLRDIDPENGGYALAIETPHMVAFNNVSGQLDPNPFRIVVWIDNQYATTNRTETMTNIACTLNLPPGLTLAPGETPTKILPSLLPNVLDTVQWTVVADGSHPGLLPFEVKVAPGSPISNPKTLRGRVMVAAFPKINLVSGPQLITMPWQLANPNMGVALGLVPGVDFVGWNWDVLTQSYVPATTFQRGRGQWIVANGNFPNVNLVGASDAGDAVTGNFHFTLRRGWNLIGNYTLYPIQLNQVNVISSGAPSDVFTWVEATQRGWIRGTVFSYDTNISDYKFSSDSSQLLPPGVGIWTYVNSNDTIVLSWPPVFSTGLPGGLGMVQAGRTEEWGTPTENKWRLQVSVRGDVGEDKSNYLGIAPSAAEAAHLSAPEPPGIPGSKVSLAFVREIGAGQPNTWAQDIREARSRHAYQLRFVTQEAGTFTLTWPNISHLPRNVRVRLTDRQTNQTRDMRMNSAYTFTMGEAGARTFDIVLEPGVPSRVVISNVNVSSGSREPNAPVTIQYSLSTSAEVSARILSTSGKEVFTINRGRAESAGLNTLVWNKRDAAGRAVAPGNYMVEIVAETEEGQRVRVTRPVVVTR